MIIDHLENASRYALGTAWSTAFQFIAGLDASAEEKRYPIHGDEMFAIVESYESKQPDSAHPEAHRTFVDIQTLLSGTELIAWWPTRALTPYEAYAPDRDIEFFRRPEAPDASVALVPGRFAVFEPRDAHMPGLQIGAAPVRVKKCVIKIAASLLDVKGPAD